MERRDNTNNNLVNRNISKSPRIKVYAVKFKTLLINK